MRDINLMNDLLFKVVFGNQKNSAALDIPEAKLAEILSESESNRDA